MITNRLIVIIGICALFAVAAAAYDERGMRLAVATGIGGLAGFSLYHASFGFTAAWRRVASEARGAGLRHQFALILVTAAISFPLVAFGEKAGFPANGFVLPFGVAGATGAFMFGVGMQLANGCGSGTLFTLGGGSTRMIFTLAAFIVGSMVAVAQLGLWADLPRLRPFSMVRAYGPFMAYLILVAALGAIALLTIYLERRKHGTLQQLDGTQSFLRGPWSMGVGVAGLALVGVLTFLVLGRPWGITSAFPFWGVKIADFIGLPITDWGPWTERTLARSVFANGTSVMDFGIIFGALIATGLAGRFSPNFHLTPAQLTSAILGGLLMGYGARLSGGCNIGAYLGGLVSGSLHGWGWMFFAFGGSILGTKLRPVFGMS